MLPPDYRARLLRLQLRAVGVLVAAVVAAVVLLPVAIFCAPLLVPAWLVAEAAFFFVFLAKLRRLAKAPQQPRQAAHEPEIAFRRWIESHYYITRTVCLEDYMATWFPGVPMRSICRGNVLDMLAQGFFYKSRAEVEAEGKGHVLQAMLLQLEQAWADRYTEGTNPRLASIAYYRHLEEPLKVVYKPLAFYAGSEVAAGLKHVLLLACGFKCHEHRGYTYYTYGLDPCSASPGAESSYNNSSGSSKEPIVFLHGVGAGLLPYLHFVQRLVATGHPLLAAEYKHLSMRWTDDIPSSQQVARDMLCIMDRHGVGRATLVSHSFGTIFTSCLLKQAPERGFKVCMVDPACCCMWSGHLVANFVYQPHRSITGIITWFISRDLHTAAAVQRNFFWTKLNLWPQEMPEHAVMVLSGKDDLVPVPHVEAMLRHETKARVLVKEGYKHADFLFDGAWQDTIVDATLKMMADASGHERSSSLSSLASSTSGTTLTAARTSSSSLSDDMISLPRMSRSSSAVSNASTAVVGVSSVKSG